jgi:hypothetical protein
MTNARPVVLGMVGHLRALHSPAKVRCAIVPHPAQGGVQFPPSSPSASSGQRKSATCSDGCGRQQSSKAIPAFAVICANALDVGWGAAAVMVTLHQFDSFAISANMEMQIVHPRPTLCRCCTLAPTARRASTTACWLASTRAAITRTPRAQPASADALRHLRAAAPG